VLEAEADPPLDQQDENSSLSFLYVYFASDGLLPGVYAGISSSNIDSNKDCIANNEERWTPEANNGW